MLLKKLKNFLKKKNMIKKYNFIGKEELRAAIKVMKSGNLDMLQTNLKIFMVVNMLNLLKIT